MTKKLVNRWVILGALGIAGILLLLSLLIGFGLTASGPDSAGFQRAELTVIPGPTSTPRFAPTPTHDPALGTATPLPGEIAVNGYAQIVGTDGDGLRLRATPGLSGDPLFLGFDTEVFLVSGGPQDADGYVWWYLVAPYDEGRAGWAASAFLEAIPAP
ncbi:MAG: hypothetical protein L3J16_03550 [Anaerolineales bacterium]|nr:hypothetical protein [Anaerolineales bacterium]